MKKAILIISIGLIGCSRPNGQIETINADTLYKASSLDTLRVLKNTIDNFSKSIVYSDIDSDSLLIYNKDLEDLILLYKREGKLVNEKRYEGSDCAGKYRQFRFNNNQLTINKSSCGDYGFSNSQFLMNGDSLLTVRKYEALWMVTSKDFEMVITEQIFFFNAGSLTLKEREKTVSDWVGFDLKNIPFNSSMILGHKEYDELKKEYLALLTYELVGD
jgi:hypothetical protein